MSADMGQFDARKTTPSSKEAQDQVFAKFKQRRVSEMKVKTNDEETGKWVVINFFPHEPAHVYGFFDTEKEAIEYAVKHKMDMYGNAFDVQMVLNAHYEYTKREPWE